jgi:hypothetical protein
LIPIAPQARWQQHEACGHRGHLHLVLALCLLAMAGAMGCVRWALSARLQEQSAKAWHQLQQQESAWSALVLARQLLRHIPPQTTMPPDGSMIGPETGAWGSVASGLVLDALRRGSSLQLSCRWHTGGFTPTQPVSAGEGAPSRKPLVCEAAPASPGQTLAAGSASGFLMQLMPTGYPMSPVSAAVAADTFSPGPGSGGIASPGWPFSPSPSPSTSPRAWAAVAHGLAPAAWGLIPVHHAVLLRPLPLASTWGAEPAWAWQVAPASWASEPAFAADQARVP